MKLLMGSVQEGRCLIAVCKFVLDTLLEAFLHCRGFRSYIQARVTLYRAHLRNECMAAGFAGIKMLTQTWIASFVAGGCRGVGVGVGSGGGGGIR